jgi:hypothetical protein
MLLVAFVAVVAIAILAVLGTMQTVARVAIGKDEDTMPDTFKRIAYVVLVVLMLGVASGWLGAA